MTSKLTRERVVALIAEHSYDSALVDALEHLLAAMDSEPVAFIDKQWTLVYYVPPMNMGLQIGDKLYRHAQPAKVTEREPIAWLNDAYLARGVVDGEAGSEDAGPGYIPVYREAGPRPAPVVTFYRDGIEAAAKWVDKQREAYDSEHGWSDPDTGVFEFGNDAQREYSSTLEELAEGIRALHPNAGNCRENTNSSTNNCRKIPETSTNRSREHFISLCNEFWNWSEMDEVCAEDRGYELRMEWDGKVFKHPVTQALWRMYQAAPQEVK
ncbi:hypothetical protein REV13_08665 [Klebsiella pneumoniae]|uniref:hypothetical protein n=1 Tax=Klebsiella pneumoniae TaxID=573 RepID=UPI002AAA6F29|nr:hypothetical protein [Klebsiella pneumoniae]WPU88480.1 hypothetical protein REV13_08665 [Klebsiella pneumoniae]